MKRAAASLVAVVAVAVAACGAGSGASATSEPGAGPTEPAEQLLALLPASPAVVVEVDLARLRANAAVGSLMAGVFAADLVSLPGTAGGAGHDPGPLERDRDGDGLPDPFADANRDGIPDECERDPDAAEAPSLPDPNEFPPSADETAATAEAAAIERKRWRQLCLPPLAPDQILGGADRLVLAAYGVGTAEASTVTLVMSDARILGATRVGDSFWALGDTAWIREVEARAGLVAAGQGIGAAEDLLALRAHAMPPNAPGASLRVVARLSTDARRTLARELGVVTAPARVSIWGDVVDDLAIIVDAEAAVGDAKPAAIKQAVTRLDRAFRAALAGLAEQPESRIIGLTASLANARLESHERWVRAVVAIGPQRLGRIVKRMTKLLDREVGELPAGVDAPTEEAP